MGRISGFRKADIRPIRISNRSEEHTSELQSRLHLVCRLLLEKKNIEHSRFVHLHCHTQYNLLDGANKIEPLFERDIHLYQPALAITDHDAMFESIEFHHEATR